MKRSMFVLTGIVLATAGFGGTAFAQEGEGVDAAVNAALGPVAEVVASVVFFSVPVFGVDVPLILVWLIVGSVFFTGYLGLINIRGFGHSIDIVRGKFDDPSDSGETTHFEALTTALSATVGLGNIAGVAIAITIGGPGAAFWMIVAAFFGMSLKFAECSLGVKYREEFEDGQVSGGPMYYIEKGLEKRGISKAIYKPMAVFYALAVMGGAFGAANMFQVNQAYNQFLELSFISGDGFWGSNAWVFGLIMAIGVGIVIIGGIKSISKVTSKLVPGMAAVYILAAIAILIANASEIPAAFSNIFLGAFTGEGVTGGIFGALIAGLQRSAFSNEAGLGSSAIAHSSAKTDLWIREGFVAQLEPFIDTVIVCTTTALVIVVTGVYESADESVVGVTLTSEAFAQRFDFFPNVLAVAVILFAFSTMISWSYYGVKAANYLFGESSVVVRTFQVVFCIFVVIGAPLALESIVPLMDALIFLMPLANLVALYVMAPEIKEDLTNYWNAYQDGTMDRYQQKAIKRRRRQRKEEKSVN